MSQYIVNVTSILRNESNQKAIALVASDLRKISTNCMDLAQIIVRGGGAIDVIAGIEPNDIDLFYSYNINGQYTAECVCDTVREVIDGISFDYFKGKDIDLENSFEKEPRLSPIERTVGLYSYHTDYNSQFAIDGNGEIWSNIEAITYYLDGIYEVRYEGFIPWAYFPHEGDSHNFWAFQVYMLIRGIGYVTKRNLVPGKKFIQMFAEYKYLIPKAIAEIGLSGFQRYAKKKIREQQYFIQYLEKYVREEYHAEVKNTFAPILELL